MRFIYIKCGFQEQRGLFCRACYAPAASDDPTGARSRNDSRAPCFQAATARPAPPERGPIPDTHCLRGRFTADPGPPQAGDHRADDVTSLT
ncbi:hypothetical protein GCM10009603_17350 [Nocardiopsis exhalans]